MGINQLEKQNQDVNAADERPANPVSDFGVFWNIRHRKKRMKMVRG